MEINIDNLIGLAEAAKILKWDKRRIATYIKRGVFPEPVARLEMGPLWEQQQIEDYRDSSGNQPLSKKSRKALFY